MDVLMQLLNFAISSVNYAIRAFMDKNIHSYDKIPEMISDFLCFSSYDYLVKL